MNEEQQQILTEIKTLVEKLEVSFKGTETEKKGEWVNGQPKERPKKD
ncbi:unnamed protein product [marine sediment metagenome]|uniref:Uncharacterized protein n=1 Tax=marine sediment metagenome TaxID=412755 RepID=X0S467_9ZZZZ